MALNTPLKHVPNVGGSAAFGGLLLLLLGAAGFSERAESVLRAVQLRMSEVSSDPQIEPGTTLKVEQEPELRMAASSAAFSSMALETAEAVSSRLDALGGCSDFCAIHPHVAESIAVP